MTDPQGHKMKLQVARVRGDILAKETISDAKDLLNLVRSMRAPPLST